MTSPVLGLGALATVWMSVQLLTDRSPHLRYWVNAVLPLAVVAGICIAFAAQTGMFVSDKTVYAEEFLTLRGTGLTNLFTNPETVEREVAYTAFTGAAARVVETPPAFFLVTAAFCTVVSVVAYLIIFKQLWQATLVLFLALSFGFFTHYAGLLIRQGLSMSMLLLAIALMIAGVRWFWWAPVLLVAMLFHWSALIPVLLIIAVKVVSSADLLRHRDRWLVLAWLGASALYLTGLNAALLAPISGAMDSLETYTDPSLAASYTGGTNRVDFWAISAVFVVVYLLARRLLHDDPAYRLIGGIYIMLNLYYLLTGFIYFSDRTAGYSWSLVPLVCAYPILQKIEIKPIWPRVLLIVGFIAWGYQEGPYQELWETFL